MTNRQVNKLLLIGWDAADWQMIHPLREAGKMPNLNALMERGVWGNLATIRPVLSPMLWNSIATGKRADKHGILGFVEPRPDANGIRPVTSTSRKCKAIWNILSQNDLSSIVVNWFASHPAEPIKGAVVTDRYEAASGGRRGSASKLSDSVFHPPRLKKPMERLHVTPDMLDAASLLPFIHRAAEINQEKDDRLAKLAMLVAKNSSTHAAACYLMTHEPWDFMAVYYTGIDQFGHHFMPYQPPKLPSVSEEDARVYGQVMEGCYRFHDMMLGALLQRSGEDTTVLLISDHGFYSDATRPGADGYENPVSWHRPFGIVCMAGPNIERDERLYGATLLDVTPTVLSAFGLPVGQDMDGRPWVEVFKQPQPPELIASWEQVDGNDGMHDESLREDPSESAEAIKHLVDLGYIDAPSDDVQTTVERTIREQKTNLALALSDSKRMRDAIPLWTKLIEQAEEYQERNEDEDQERSPGGDGGNTPQALLIKLARCHLALREFEPCEAALDRLRDEAKQHPTVLLMRAHIHLAQGHAEEALELLYAVQEIAPGAPALLEAFGAAYVLQGKYLDAQWAFDSVLEQNPETATAINGLAQVALARRKYQDAIELSLQAVDLIHHFPSAHLHLGQALAAAGQTQEAILALTTAVAMAPCMKDGHRLLAHLYRSTGRDDETIKRHEWASR